MQQHPYAVIAATQFGLVTTGQLRASGISRVGMAWLVRSGQLQSVRRGVYRVAGTTPTWMSSVLAAVLAGGDGALASHETAGYLHRLRHIEPPAVIELVGPKRLSLDGVRWHKRPPLPGIATWYRRIPATTVEVTVALVSDRFGAAQLGEMVDDALRRGVLRLERLRAIAAALDGPGRRNLSALRKVLADRPRHYIVGDSDWEQSQDALWDRLGLPPGVRHYPVTVRGGRRYTLDRALPELKIGIEWDGYRFHRDRTAFDRDRQRAAELGAAGWTVLQFTSNSTPAFIDRVVRQAIERQAIERQAIERQAIERQAIERQARAVQRHATGLSPAAPSASGATTP